MTEREPSGPSYSYSIEEAGQRDLLVLDSRGRTISRRRRRINGTVYYATMAGLIGLGFWISVPTGIGGVIGVVFHRLWLRGRGITLAKVMHLVTYGDIEEAKAALERFPRERLAPRHQPVLSTLAGRLWMRMGEPEKAVSCFEASVREFEALGGRRGETINYWIARISLASVLVRLRRIDEARRAMPEPGEQPEPELLMLARCYTEVQLAFYTGDDRYLPDEQVLHDVGKLGLKSNAFGSTLVTVAWAFDRLGDTELAEHFLRESQSRLNRQQFQDYDPEIVAWMDQRLATIEPDELS